MNDNYWMAIYEDGRVFTEVTFDGTGSRSWGQVPDKSQIKELRFIDLEDGLLVKTEIPQGAEPVLFRRHRVEVDRETGGEVGHTVFPCVGWRMAGKEEYCFARPSQGVLVTSDLNAI